MSLIEEWKLAKEAASAAVENERLLREKVVSEYFPNATKGTQRNGKLKLVLNYTYPLGDSTLKDEAGNKVPVSEQVSTVLDEIEKLGEAGKILAEKIVKWKPELDVTFYNKLDTSNNVEAVAKRLIDEILTVKPVAPQLSVEE